MSILFRLSVRIYLYMLVTIFPLAAKVYFHVKKMGLNYIIDLTQDDALDLKHL
jgi:hypothetical protein